MNELADKLIAEFERRAARDHALAKSQTGAVGFGITASFAACWSQAADVVREINAECPLGDAENLVDRAQKIFLQAIPNSEMVTSEDFNPIKAWIADAAKFLKKAQAG